MIKELYRVIQSSDFSENITIPVSLSTSCKSFSIFNGRTAEESVNLTITVKGKTLPVPAGCSSGLISFERDWFKDFTIETADLGHNFIMEIYRD